MTAAPADVPHGIALVDKPQGHTSHGIVAWTRKSLGTRKVGHAGTLDPMATGLLVIGVGHATRLLTYLVGEDKEYFATIRFGIGTSTEDAEGEIVERSVPDVVAAITRERLTEAMALLTGGIEQVPSAVSAIKIDGKRSYQRVRDGEDVQLKARPVTIHEFELLDIDEPEEHDGTLTLDIRVRVVCSSGTYIRALARDLGVSLGACAHLTALRRTRVGNMSLEDAVDTTAPLTPANLTPSSVVARRRFPSIDLSDDEALDIWHGKRIALPAGWTPPEEKTPVAAFNPAGQLVGLVECSRTTMKSCLNFPEPLA